MEPGVEPSNTQVLLGAGRAKRPPPWAMGFLPPSPAGSVVSQPHPSCFPEVLKTFIGSEQALPGIAVGSCSPCMGSKCPESAAGFLHVAAEMVSTAGVLTSIPWWSCPECVETAALTCHEQL